MLPIPLVVIIINLSFRLLSKRPPHHGSTPFHPVRGQKLLFPAFWFPSLRLSRRWATLRVGREDVCSLPGRLSQCLAYKKNVTFCLFVVLDAHSFWHNWGQNMTSITFFHQDKVFFARKVEHEISLIFNGTKYQKLKVRLVINFVFNGL